MTVINHLKGSYHPFCENCTPHDRTCECIHHARPNVTATAALLAVASVGQVVYGVSRVPPCVRCAQYHGTKPCRRKGKRL